MRNSRVTAKKANGDGPMDRRTDGHTVTCRSLMHATKALENGHVIQMVSIKTFYTDAVFIHSPLKTK